MGALRVSCSIQLGSIRLEARGMVLVCLESKDQMEWYVCVCYWK